MKKILFALLVLVIAVCLAAPAMAAGKAKPPKSICLQAEFSTIAFCMAIKRGATWTTPGGTKVSMYAIQGAITSPSPQPAVGAGYMNDSNFIFHLSASYGGTDTTIYGDWDVETETGVMIIHATNSGGFTSTQYNLVSY